MAMHRTHCTGLVCCALITLLLLRGADAQRGRIQFTGQLLTPAAPLTTFATGAHVLPDGNSALKHEVALSSLTSADQPELLLYFAGYAGRDARLVVTTYE